MKVNKSNIEKAYFEEIEFIIETILDDDFEDYKDKKVLKALNNEDKEKIVDLMLNDDELNETIYNTIRYYLFHR